MKKSNLIKNLLLGLGCASAITAMHAATQPRFTIIPTTPTTVAVPLNGTATVQYTVTNQTKITRTLTIKPLSGITQVTTGEGVCSSPFTLAPKESCLLTLSLNGINLPEHIGSGPEVCKTQNPIDNSPDPFVCSQPSQADSLNIDLRRDDLTIKPTTLILTAGSGVEGQIVVTSNLKVRSALNVAADFTGTALAGNVIQNAADCAILAPGASCTLHFLPKLQAVGPISVPIQGTNTGPVGVSIAVVNPSAAPISVSPSQVNVKATTGTPVTQSVTVTNDSNVLTTTPIAGTITGNLTTANVTIACTTNCSGSVCNPLAPGETCGFTFTPGNLPSSGGNVTGAAEFVGSNTYLTSVPVTVVAANAATIAFNTASLTHLEMQQSGTTTTGNVPAVMTIKNTSSTGGEVAQGVIADFVNTGIAGVSVVYNPATTIGCLNSSASCCANLSPGATCTLTFNSGTTPVAQQLDFSIRGTNTTAIDSSSTTPPSISVGSFAYIEAYIPADPNQGRPVDIGRIARCPITNTGTLGSSSLMCLDSGFNTSQANGQEGLAINRKKTRLYVTNTDNSSILSCVINPDATIGISSGSNHGICDSVLPATLAVPTGIALLESSSTAFVANYIGSIPVSSCTINSDGTIGACVNSGASSGLFIESAGLALNPAGTKLYISNEANGKVVVCPVTVGAPATLSSCTDSGATNLSFPNGIVFSTTGNNLVYIANKGNSTVATCSVNPSTGLLSACVTQSSTGFNGPAGLALNNAPATTALGTFGTLYVTNNASTQANSAQSYPITDEVLGTLGSATDSVTHVSMAHPTGIAILQH